MTLVIRYKERNFDATDIKMILDQDSGIQMKSGSCHSVKPDLDPKLFIFYSSRASDAPLIGHKDKNITNSLPLASYQCGVDRKFIFKTLLVN